jgi:hypothetical protein
MGSRVLVCLVFNMGLAGIFWIKITPMDCYNIGYCL